MNERRNIFSTKWNIFQRTRQDTMENMLSIHSKDSPVKLQVMSGFTSHCSTNMESYSAACNRFNSEIIEINETQAPISWILL